MCELVLDCDDMQEGERHILETALSKAFTSDMPLVLEVIFVSEAEIRDLNRRERGVDRVTDVLSFPAMELTAGEPVSSEEHGECVEGEEGEERLYLGSVAVCTQRAHEQAEEYGHSYAREVCYLIAHGMLHCLGYDHETEQEKAVMRKKEEELMQGLGLGREE